MHAIAGWLENLYLSPLRTQAHSSRLVDSRRGLRVRRLGRVGMRSLRPAAMSVADGSMNGSKRWMRGYSVPRRHDLAQVRPGGTASTCAPPRWSLGVFRPPLSNAPEHGGPRGLNVRARRTQSRGDGTRVRRGARDGTTLPCDAIVRVRAPRALLECRPRMARPGLVSAVRRIRSREYREARAHLDREPVSTLVIAPSLDYRERAYDDVKYRASPRAVHEERYNARREKTARGAVRSDPRTRGRTSSGIGPGGSDSRAVVDGFRNRRRFRRGLVKQPLNTRRSRAHPFSARPGIHGSSTDRFCGSAGAAAR